MSWARVALRIMPYPDIYLVGLGVECAGDMPHEFELITCQKLPIHTILAIYGIYAQN